MKNDTPKTLNECFNELIKKREWYINSDVDKKKASKDKAAFLAGKLSEDKIRNYLMNAGYQLFQAEMWIKKNKDIL